MMKYRVNGAATQILVFRANLKTGVTRKQSMQNFPKDEHFLLPNTHTHKLAV